MVYRPYLPEGVNSTGGRGVVPIRPMAAAVANSG